MSASEMRRLRRLCHRKGHLWRTKTDGEGRTIKLPCDRCGLPQEGDHK